MEQIVLEIYCFWQLLTGAQSTGKKEKKQQTNKNNF